MSGDQESRRILRANYEKESEKRKGESQRPQVEDQWAFFFPMMAVFLFAGKLRV